MTTDLDVWRKALKVVPADFKGLLAFRQFRLTAGFRPMPFPAFARTLRAPDFSDDFTLRSMQDYENWLPRGNIARCYAPNKPPHRVADRECHCGYYGSYSSSIIYEPNLLKNEVYCFAAVRMYGKEIPLAHNGLRSTGANVDGVLLQPGSRDIPSVKRFLRRLSDEGIFYTFSARQFLERFPDESYEELLGFDPVQHVAGHTEIVFDKRPLVSDPDEWRNRNYSAEFFRPVRPEMLLRRIVPEKTTPQVTTYEISLRPEYRPGGSLYVHPLLEVWKR